MLLLEQAISQERKTPKLVWANCPLVLSFCNKTTHNTRRSVFIVTFLPQVPEHYMEEYKGIKNKSRRTYAGMVKGELPTVSI